MNTDTIRETAERMWPGTTYDYAMPQAWVDDCVSKGFDPRGQVVWGYPDNCVFGIPLPLSANALWEMQQRGIK